MNESELCRACEAWLREQGFETYGEVEPAKSGRRFDLVGLRGEEVWVVETKTAYSIDLRRQLQGAQRFAHRLFAGIPWRKKPVPGAGMPGAPWDPKSEDRHGILYVQGSSVFLARDAQRLEGEFASMTRAASSRYHLGFAGGQTSAEGGGKLTGFRVLVWNLHRHFWGREWFELGEAVEAAKEIAGPDGYQWKNPRALVWEILAKQKCFDLLPGEEETQLRWVCNGRDVPADCKPGAPPPSADLEQIHFPRRRPR